MNKPENLIENEASNISHVGITCENCGDISHRDFISYVDGHGPICQNCLDSDYNFCKSCDRYCHNNTNCSCDDSGP